MKKLNHNIDWEYEIVKKAFWDSDLLLDYSDRYQFRNGAVIELPYKASLSTIFKVNQEFTYNIFPDEMWPVSYVVYPQYGNWVIQTIHGHRMPNEWARSARPAGLISLYLDNESKYKNLDRAIFSNREDCNKALNELLCNIFWDHGEYYGCRREGKKFLYTYDRDPMGFFPWESLGKEEYKNKRAK